MLTTLTKTGWFMIFQYNSVWIILIWFWFLKSSHIRFGLIFFYIFFKCTNKNNLVQKIIGFKIVNFDFLKINYGSISNNYNNLVRLKFKQLSSVILNFKNCSIFVLNRTIPMFFHVSHLPPTVNNTTSTPSKKTAKIYNKIVFIFCYEKW